MPSSRECHRGGPEREDEGSFVSGWRGRRGALARGQVVAHDPPAVVES